MWVCGFNNSQSQCMFHMIGRKMGHEYKKGNRQRDEEETERETVQHEEDDRTNSASIVSSAWLIF